jgi:hypothetical protein
MMNVYFKCTLEISEETIHIRRESGMAAAI